MRCLSIRQPWAWLIVRPDLTGVQRAAATAAGEIKDIENRNWATRVRGRTLVHAAKGMTRDEYEAAVNFAVVHCGVQTLPPPEALPRGGIVGAVDIVDCIAQSSSRWFVGTYGFRLENSAPLPFAPLRGQLGFFDVPAELLQRAETEPTTGVLF